MKIATCVAVSLMLLTLAGAAVSGQGQKPSDKPEAELCTVEFSRFLVDQQVADSRSVTETDKRIRILTRSADFIWKLDQPTAREYFTEAFKVANDRFNEKGFEKKTDKGITITSPDHRFEVIRAIAAKDGEWSKRLTEQILKEYEKTAAERSETDRSNELTATLRVAEESVTSNPELSWYLFRRVMRQPLDFYWFWTPYSVANKDPKFADALYRELLSNYANETPRRLLFLSAYPFGGDRPLGLDKFHYGTSVPGNFRPNTSLQRQFIDVLFRRVTAYANDPASVNRPREGYRHSEPLYLVTALNDLEPMIVQQFPDLVQRYSAARATASSLLNEEMKKELADKERQNERTGSSFEERLAEIEKADEEGKLKDSMILGLLTWGDKTEEQFKQLEPWLEKITDEPARKESINYFWFLRSKLAIKENRLDDAQRHAAKVPEMEHRAILLFEIAELKLKDVNDAASVYQMLNEIGKTTRQLENSPAKARVLLGLANLYEQFNHTFALDELSDAVKVVNRLENPDMLSTSLYRRIAIKDYSFSAGFGMPKYDLERTFRAISKNDFDMGLSNARALEDKFYRTLAVIAVAQNCIDRPKPKTGKQKAAASLY